MTHRMPGLDTTRAHTDGGAVPGAPDEACASSSNTDLCASARHDAMAGSVPGKGARVSPEAAPRAIARRAKIPFATRGPLAATMVFEPLRCANTRASDACRCVVPRGEFGA